MTVRATGIPGETALLAGAWDRPEDKSRWPVLEGPVSTKEEGAW